ncbi:unnamed protein product [Prorocentrum cordatum]|uniref:Uncharacterized protein n=1 Tax=Prorocentrum cordatum TaxID=2364126 RepID=A0ABN9RMS9_9DINO|nr:unnamed protein product [Polarella glacialis]
MVTGYDSGPQTTTLQRNCDCGRMVGSRRADTRFVVALKVPDRGQRTRRSRIPPWLWAGSRRTNDRWRSTPHRVAGPRAGSAAAERPRLSCMLFSGPHLDNVIGPIPTCCDARNPPRYSPMKARDHLKAQYITKSKEADYNPAA